MKIEVRNEETSDVELMRLLVEASDGDCRAVSGNFDSEPISNTDMRLGMTLAVSYNRIRDLRTSALFDVQCQRQTACAAAVAPDVPTPFSSR